MKEILMNALVDIGLAVLIAVGGALIVFIKTKVAQINASSANSLENKIRLEVADAVEDAVNAVNQTFVNELKANNLFDEEKQLEAFEKALEGTINVLSRETIDFINNNYGDIEIWLKDKIEATVLKNKK